MALHDRDLQPERPGRRAWLTGMLGGLAAWAAAAAAKIDPAGAAAGDPVLAGRNNSGGLAQTRLTSSTSGPTLGAVNKTTSGMALLAHNTSGGTGYNAGSGIRALTGGGSINDIHPNGADWDAAGEFAGPNGVIGATNVDGYGVIGKGEPDGTGVWGGSGTGVGVEGAASAVDGTGVRGTAAVEGVGVEGVAEAGFGVSGTGIVGVAGYSSDGDGVKAVTDTGLGLYAEAYETQGWAGWFEGRVLIRSLQVANIRVEKSGTVSAPSSGARVFARDNAGKTQLCVIFPTGAVQVIAAEP